jgi:predicted GH43/DUF377 family glycosyl hydrolase
MKILLNLKIGTYVIQLCYFLFFLVLFSCKTGSNNLEQIVTEERMQEVFNEIQTPYKYGVVFKHPDSTKLIDSPTIYRENKMWYMTYIVFDGQGYETWLAESKDLLEWRSKGKLLSFTKDTWDANQKAGYVALVNYDWGGNYEVEKHKENYWMSYLGGNSKGYEAGTLKIGMANSKTISKATNWKTMKNPVLSPKDSNVRWFENKTIYKSLIIKDSIMHTGYPYVMYYNAKGTDDFESIGMAVSNDLTHWERFGNDPVISRGYGICGDAQIAKYKDLYIMFYFGAFWKPGAFERFACSYDLIHWTDWEGPDLIAPSENYDEEYAHKPWVIKWKGIVYHFYNAVGSEGRVIALATSKDIKEKNQ